MSTDDLLADDLGTRLGRPATFATTEHFNLQTARSTTVSEANGRASIYLAALSSSLIALAFIGQMSRLGAAFYAFALILLPVVAFVGTVTFLRLVQACIEEIAYAHRIALLGRVPQFAVFLMSFRSWWRVISFFGHRYGNRRSEVRILSGALSGVPRG
jgi:hypothetical protein